MPGRVAESGVHHRAERCFGILGIRTRARQRLGSFNDLFLFDTNAHWRAHLTLGTGQEEKLGPDDQEQEDIDSA